MEASCIRYKEVEIQSEKIPQTADGYRIALVSDIHLSPCLRRSVAEKAARIVKEAKPDLLLNAGDFLDGAGKREQSMATLFKGIAPQGSFSIIGNHEVYFGVKESEEMHELGGFRVLRDKGIEIDDWLYVHGVDDDAIRAVKSVVVWVDGVVDDGLTGGAGGLDFALFSIIQQVTKMAPMISPSSMAMNILRR